jgi:cytidine deaminase
MSEHRQDKLIDAAREARSRAVAPHSRFHVGAALEAANGEIIIGCNVESASYGLTVCAERVAVWKALSEGVREFTRIAVVADTTPLTPPCGACRQVLWEQCGDIEIVLANLNGEVEAIQLAALLPRPFDSSLLK